MHIANAGRCKQDLESSLLPAEVVRGAGFWGEKRRPAFKVTKIIILSMAASLL